MLDVILTFYFKKNEWVGRGGESGQNPRSSQHRLNSYLQVPTWPLVAEDSRLSSPQRSLVRILVALSTV